jgi:hypothetical protein
MLVTMPESPVTIIRNHWSRSAGIRTRQVLDYLGRYTHRVAIWNHRLQRFDGHV